MAPLIIIGLVAIAALLVLVAANRPKPLTNWVISPDVLPESDDLHFRLAEARDIDALIALANEPENAAANGWDANHIERVEQRLRSPGLFGQYRLAALVAVEQTSQQESSQRVVAVATLQDAPPKGHTGLSIGLQVSASHSNRGYGTQVMAAAITLFRTAPADELWVGTATANLAVQRIMTHLGYEPEPGASTYTAPNGQSLESLWYRCGSPRPPPARPAGSSSDL